MGRIFTGLLKCGAWGCFDEFNRLEEEVLSAVSSQIQTIQAALKSRPQMMTFMGRDINVNHNAGIFVTLNPAGKGYGGRSKLPDNLKQLFRSVAMTVPNFELIAEVILLSEGFTIAARAWHQTREPIFPEQTAALSAATLRLGSSCSQDGPRDRRKTAARRTCCW